ncbi:MAG: reverse transcriptase domain-containing protein [Candidatus Thiodiazotropha endolucinida]|nr:reverse transcriptase domain-containing protein [Candidatus Thiodiazotropha endolucinida]
MTILNINFQSVRNKIPEFCALLEAEKPDIVVGTETWLTPEIANNEILPKDLGYNIFRRDRTSGTGGGVFILVKNGILASEQLHCQTDCEIVWVRIDIVGSRPLFIASYYRPKENDALSLAELKRSLTITSQEKGNMWVLGDMNFPKLSWDEEDVPLILPGCNYPGLYEEFIDILNEFSLSQVVREATRCGNILDLFLTSNITLINTVQILPGLSDHDIVKSAVSIKPRVVKQNPRKTFLYRKADWESFRQFISSFSTSFMPEVRNKTVDEAWTDFKNAIHDGINKFIPAKLLSSKKHLPWISNHIRRDMRKRDKLYRKFKTSKTADSRKKFLKIKHSVKRQIKVSYENYLQGILGINSSSDNDQDQVQSDFSRKRLFSLLKNSKQDSQGISLLKEGEYTYTTNVDKANSLNRQFRSVFSARSALNLVKLCQGALLSGVQSGLNLLIPDSFQSKVPAMPDIVISANGVLKLLTSLNPSKAAGPDAIKPVVLKELANEIAPIVAAIFQLSLDTGTVPSDWKKAFVTPLFKKGDKTNPANYRPISLTCILCKTMEHIIASNLTRHFEEHNILYDLQHGFRERRSCETQLIQLVEDLARSLTQGKQTDLILLDFSKAFDKVNHLKLLYKLQMHGVQGKAHNWIQSFLMGRSQRVVLEGECSDEVPVSSGVPQGSVLGPILFLLYINDLPDNVQSQVRLFADDTAVYLTINGPDSSAILQKDLDQLQQWEALWDMEFNPGKCQVLHITRSQNPIKTQYTMHGQVLESVPTARYLGVDISTNLSFNTHINRITANANKSLGFIKRNVKCKHPGVREAAYKTIVRPQLEYGSTVCGPYTQTYSDIVEMIQHRAARWTLSRFSSYDSVTDMLSQLGWRSLDQRRSDARLCMFYKIMNGLVAVPLPPYFQQVTTRTRHGQSHPLAIRQIHTTYNYYKYSFFPLAVWQWNKLPPCVVLLPTLTQFSVAVRSLDHKLP